jgi:hypothetical protein
VLNENNRKAELSYAYLHAVAAAAGFSCFQTPRPLDNEGIDAQLDLSAKLDPESFLTDICIRIQLKATSQDLNIASGKLSFPLTIAHYDKLRSEKKGIPLLLVVLHLPPAEADWLQVTGDQLIAKRCGRWVSLRAAPASTHDTSQTVYLPVDNVLTPDALREIARRHSRGEVFNYAG